LADVINDMAARIAQQLSDQKSLLAAVSHEIRTPLARMRFLAEMARTQGCADKTADSLDREIVEVDKLVGDLLASSRLDFDARSDVPLVPADLARRAVEQLDLDPTILDVEENLPSFDGDPTLLVRALVNLLENARKHAGSAETFRVYFRTGRICFVVEDRGPGFEPDECEKVFEPFYKRSKSNASTSESIGLGLSLVKRIAKTHGGIAYAKNREGGGACVGIEIPRLRMAR
jgi:signal transduction histidine kinase